METKKRYDFIDLLKGIAICIVVISHFNNMPINFLDNSSFSTYFNYFLQTIFCFSVPIFFFANGFLLLNKRSIDVKSHALKVLRIIALSILWGAITMIALSLIKGETLTLNEFIKGSYFLKQGWNNHLWFLGALTCIYIFFPLIYTAFKNNKQVFNFFLICVMIFTFGDVLLEYLLNTTSFLLNKFNNLDFRIDFGGMYDPFQGIYGYSIGVFMLGGLAFNYKESLNKKKYKYISIGGFLLSMFLLFLYGVICSYRQQSIWNIWYGLDSVFALLCVIFLFIITLNYTSRGKIGAIISTLGNNSLGIYFTHIIFGHLTKPIFVQMDISTALWANIIYASVVLLLSLFATLLMKKIPVVKFLFSI